MPLISRPKLPTLPKRKSSVSKPNPPPAPTSPTKEDQSLSSSSPAVKSPEKHEKEKRFGRKMTSTPNPARDPLSGHPGHLSEEQEKVLADLKKELEADGIYKPSDPEKDGQPTYDDPCILRFCRARKFNFDDSKLMFVNYHNWRNEFQVDQKYYEWTVDPLGKARAESEKNAVNKLYPTYYHKTDKDGRPVYIEQLGKLDVYKLWEVTTPERVIERLVVEYEKLLRERLPVASRERGELVETSCTIMDLSGVGLTSFYSISKHIQGASYISQNYYPETMGKFYIINAPWGFSTIWSVAKRWLDEVTVSKIGILDWNYKQTLLQQIPPYSLPKEFGGTCTCSEEGGCLRSDAGPWKDEPLKEEACGHASVPLSKVGLYMESGNPGQEGGGHVGRQENVSALKTVPNGEVKAADQVTEVPPTA